MIVAQALLILARVLICLVLFCLPFFIFIAASGKSENAMILVIPFFGAIPAVLGALLIFVPVEAYLDRHGLERLKNIMVPIAGALLVAIFMLIMWGVQGRLLELLAWISTGDINMIWPILLWSILGAIWGSLWRLTAWIAAKAGARWHRLALRIRRLTNST